MTNQILSVIHDGFISRSNAWLTNWAHLSVICALTCSVLSPNARAVSPPPDGGYANWNTAEGESALNSLTTGAGNTAVGNTALYSITGASDNTAVGWGALNANTGNYNTAVGMFALVNSTIGEANTALGQNALVSNTTGGNNTAVGRLALANNSNGSGSTAIGVQALYSYNDAFIAASTATGYQALFSTVDGYANTADGYQALFSDTTGGENTAVGDQALFTNTTGHGNTANGGGALFSNTTGGANTANGDGALFSNTTGVDNTAHGYFALYYNTTGSSNTAIGQSALVNNTTGGSNIALGDSAGSLLTTGSNNIDIGNKGVAGEAKTIRIGKKGTQTTTVIAGISGTTVAGGISVMIDGNGRLGTTTSSARYKEDIQPMSRASEAILSLQPVMFRYKHELDPAGIPQFGLVAEQVERVNPDLVAHDDNGKPYSVRYDAVNAMLLNEFLEAHRTLEEQCCRLAEQEATIKTLWVLLQTQAEKQGEEVAALRSQVQKMSNQLSFGGPAPRVIVHNP